MTPEQLLKEYQTRVEMQDELMAANKIYHAGRRAAGDEDGMRYARSEFFKQDALRQAYVQMVKDLEDLV